MCCGDVPSFEQLLRAGFVVGACPPAPSSDRFYGCAHCGAVLLGSWLTDHECFTVRPEAYVPGAPFLFADPFEGA